MVRLKLIEPKYLNGLKTKYFGQNAKNYAHVARNSLGVKRRIFFLNTVGAAKHFALPYRLCREAHKITRRQQDFGP